MSRAKKVDANQSEIVDTFRALGAKVAITSSAGDGFPDLVVQFRNYDITGCRAGSVETYLVEVKDGAKPPSKRKLTPDQEIFHSIFVCCIVETVKDVYELLEVNYHDNTTGVRKMKKQQMSLMEILKEYRSIELDMRKTISKGQAEHDLQRLKENNDRLETNVTGHGTGDD